MTESYTDIIYQENFNNLAIIFNIPFHSWKWRRDHGEVPFWSLWNQFDKVTPAGDMEYNKHDVIRAFTDLLFSVTNADPLLLWYTEDDLKWFVSVLDGPRPHLYMNLFKAWVSATHTYLTPAELEEITGLTASNWRNRARGERGYKPIPGCRKPGKDWLIPLAVLQAQGDVSREYGRERKEWADIVMEKTKQVIQEIVPPHHAKFVAGPDCDKQWIDIWIQDDIFSHEEETLAEEKAKQVIAALEVVGLHGQDHVEHHTMTVTVIV